MTREEIIAQVNNLLEEEFEVEQSEFAPDANLKGHSLWTVSIW